MKLPDEIFSFMVFSFLKDLSAFSLLKSGKSELISSLKEYINSNAEQIVDSLSFIF